jgi:hypothetical protein
MKKRMDDVEQTAPRKRGGQRGNRNAVKTGRHTAVRKAERRRIGTILADARALIRSAHVVLAEMRHERNAPRSGS